MTNNEKRADEICARFNGTTFSDSDESLEWLRVQITEALNAAQAEGYKQGAEKMREDAVWVCDEWAENAASVEPEHVEPLRIITAQDLAAKIEALPITPPQPAAQAEDDEREMRDAFEKWVRERAPKYTLARPGAAYIEGVVETLWNGWQAAWKEARK